MERLRYRWGSVWDTIKAAMDIAATATATKAATTVIAAHATTAPGAIRVVADIRAAAADITAADTVETASMMQPGSGSPHPGCSA
jgi:hypothetical protein